MRREKYENVEVKCMLWITGANGLLGKALNIECPTAFATGQEGDICNTLTIRDLVKNKPITHIINCAAFSNVDAAERDRDEAWRVNAIGPENLAKLSLRIGAQLVHISTDYVFDGENGEPYKETDTPNPCNAYGKSKLEGEKRVLQIAPQSLIIRTSSLFGAGGKNFVTKIRELFKTQNEIFLTNDSWNKMTYVPDLAKALLQMLGKTGIFHFANEGITNKYEFGLAMKEILNANIKITPVPSSYFPSSCKRPPYSPLDTAKIHTHMRPRHWQSALKDYLCAHLPACS